MYIKCTWLAVVSDPLKNLIQVLLILDSVEGITLLTVLVSTICLVCYNKSNYILNVQQQCF